MTLLSPACRCSRGTFVADAPGSRVDPTGTTVARKRFEADLVRRFKKLRRQIIQAIVELDVLGLKDVSSQSLSQQLSSHMFTRLFAPGVVPAHPIGDATPGAKAFAYGRSGDKVASFMEWLKQTSREDILSVRTGTSMARAGQSAWTNVYIDTAYQKGIRDAYAVLGMNAPGSVAGAFNQPIHADRVGLIYTRTFNELDGVTDAMAQGISRTLAQGMAEGRGARDIANDLADRVDKIGITRARTIARSEMISAHAEAQLNSYEEAGVEGVNVVAEFSTAGDDQVCPECEDLEGQEYSLEDARGLIPVHPNCRCSFVPVVKD